MTVCRAWSSSNWAGLRYSILLAIAATCLVEELAKDTPTIVGIDHGFSFPMRYFEARGVNPDWPTFLDDFQKHWPTDERGVWVRDVRTGAVGNGAERSGDRDWRRLVERRVRSAKSVFRFGVN